MDQFAESFFPDTAGHTQSSFWCSFDDEKLQAYSAIMHFTGAVASLLAAYFTQHHGRTRCASGSQTTVGLHDPVNICMKLPISHQR